MHNRFPPLNEHLISVLRDYLSARQTGKTGRIEAGEKIIKAILLNGDVESALADVTDAYPLPKAMPVQGDESAPSDKKAYAETLSHMLSYDVLVNQLGFDKEKLDSVPPGFDYTLLLLGVIHHNLPPFMMEYQKAVRGQVNSLKTLKLIEVNVTKKTAPFSIQFSFLDTSLSVTQLRRYERALGLTGDKPPVLNEVTGFEEDELLSALAPFFNRHQTTLRFNEVDQTVSFSWQDSPDTFLDLLATLIVEAGIKIDMSIIPEEIRENFNACIVEKIETYLGNSEDVLESDTIHSLEIMEALYAKPVKPHTKASIELVEGLIWRCVMSEMPEYLNKAYLLLPEPCRALLVRDLAMACLEKPRLRKLADSYLKTSDVAHPYQRLQYVEDSRNYGTKYSPRRLPRKKNEQGESMPVSNRVKHIVRPYCLMFSRTQDLEFNRFTGTKLRSYTNDDMPSSKSMSEEEAIRAIFG